MPLCDLQLRGLSLLFYFCITAPDRIGTQPACVGEGLTVNANCAQDKGYMIQGKPEGEIDGGDGTTYRIVPVTDYGDMGIHALWSTQADVANVVHLVNMGPSGIMCLGIEKHCEQKPLAIFSFAFSGSHT